MGQIGYPETSVANCQSTLRKFPTKRRWKYKDWKSVDRNKEKNEHFAAEVKYFTITW